MSTLLSHYNNNDDIEYKLRKRAEIRRTINTRKSVQEGKADRLSDLLEQAADEIARLRAELQLIKRMT